MRLPSIEFSTNITLVCNKINQHYDPEYRAVNGVERNMRVLCLRGIKSSTPEGFIQRFVYNDWHNIHFVLSELTGT
jgi:hypothetical protein